MDYLKKKFEGPSMFSNIKKMSFKPRVFLIIFVFFNNRCFFSKIIFESSKTRGFFKELF